MGQHSGSDVARSGLLVRAARSLMGFLGALSGIGIALLALPTVVDVFYRKTFGPSVPGVVEISEVALVCVIILGMAAALRDGDHVATPILTDRLPERLGAALQVAGLVLVAILLAIMVVGTFRAAVISFNIQEYRMGLIQVPVWPAKAAIPLGLAALLIEVIIQVCDHFSRFSQNWAKNRRGA